MHAAPLQSHWDWIGAILSIVLIDLILAGDNAVLIALAVRRLHGRARLLGTTFGAGAAVVLRIILTAVAARLLSIPGLKLVGGLLILWIAVKLLREESGPEESSSGREAHSLRQAIWLIVVADISMSLDNVLAVAGASHGHTGLMIFGLGLSIPLVVFASNLLARLMDRYPLVVYGGAAILGYVGAGMIVTDAGLAHYWQPSWWGLRLCEAAGAVLVLAASYLLRWPARTESPP